MTDLSIKADGITQILHNYSDGLMAPSENKSCNAPLDNRWYVQCGVAHKMSSSDFITMTQMSSCPMGSPNLNVDYCTVSFYQSVCAWLKLRVFHVKIWTQILTLPREWHNWEARTRHRQECCVSRDLYFVDVILFLFSYLAIIFYKAVVKN